MHTIILGIIFLYLLLIVRYAFGWSKRNQITNKNYTPFISVVIALRNEESEVIRLLRNLQAQIYPSDRVEFILVNDHSTDKTLELLQKNQVDNLHIIDMLHDSGKKKSIANGVKKAKGEIIIATDADCSFGLNWIQTMANYFSDAQIKLVSGPVTFNKQRGIFQSLQALEFTSLIGSGAGAIGSGSAIFCNGANMAYRRDVFLEVNNFDNDTVASGDDVFLLHSVKAKYNNSIAFAKDKSAIVTTNGVQTLKGFVNQRKRWASKSSGYKDPATIYASFLVFFTNLAFVLLFFMCFIDVALVQLFLGFYSVKFFADLYLLVPALKFFDRIDLVKWILPFEFFYSFYIVLIVALSFRTSFEWKGRIHKK